ncbi:hypothetical protein [Parasphingorhabdus sp.]|uniref:hypothetical protein n=1 Tax=Parasphingorhabdus sp. TaxID=2709688 RepID=UPI003A8DB5C2
MSIPRPKKLVSLGLALTIAFALASPATAQRGGRSITPSTPPSTRTAPPVSRDVIQDRTRDRIDVPDQERIRDQDRVDTADQDRIRDHDPLYLGTRDRLQTFDRDSDGLIDQSEFQQWHESAYDAINAGGKDGFSLQEFEAVRLGPGPMSDTAGPQRQRNEQTAQLRKAERFRLMDSDDNGVVTRSEYMKSGESNFPGADVNNDGKLSYGELEQFHRGW